MQTFHVKERLRRALDKLGINLSIESCMFAALLAVAYEIGSLPLATTALMPLGFLLSDLGKYLQGRKLIKGAERDMVELRHLGVTLNEEMHSAVSDSEIDGEYQ